MIVDHRESDEYLELARLDKIPLGLGIGCPLDEYLRFKKGSFNIILGHPNVGKTYWLMFYLLCLAKTHNKKCLVYSAENTINSIKRNLIELYTGKTINNLSEADLEEAKIFVEAHFDFWTLKRVWTVDEFMKQVQAMKGYDILMIDPLNSFSRPRGMNMHEAEYENANKIKIWGMNTGITTYVVMHTNTESQRRTHKDGEFEGLRTTPIGADAEGGGKWSSRRDDSIIVHRYTQSQFDWMNTRVTIEKIKETETGGKPSFLTNPITFKRLNSTQFECGGINPLEAQPLKENFINLVPNENF